MRFIPCVLLPIAMIALLGADPHPTSPPQSAGELITRFQQAINSRDHAAVDALVYWGNANTSSRAMMESLLSVYEAETITSARLTPVDTSVPATFSMPDGTKYGASIPPLYSMVVQYAHGPDVTVDQGSLPIGVKDGAWYIVAIVPVK